MPSLTAIFAQGLFSARPTADATTNNGIYYYATDTGALYQNWNGTWVKLAPSSATLVPLYLASAIGSTSVAGISATTIDFFATAGGTSFTDITTALNGSTPGPTLSFGAVNDAVYFGSTSAGTGRYTRVTLSRGQAPTQTLTLVWEYYNGASWSTFGASSNLFDSTTALTTAGSVSFLPPTDWATVAVNGTTAYWIRARCTAFTSNATPAKFFGAQMRRFSDWSAGSLVIPVTGTITSVRGLGTSNMAFYNVTTGAYSLVPVSGNPTTCSIPVNQNDSFILLSNTSSSLEASGSGFIPYITPS